VVVIGSCGLLALCFKRPSELAGTLLALSFWMCVMCLTGVQLVFSLYPDPKGCYVSTAGQGLKTASTVIVTLSACMIYGTTARLPVKVRGIFATLQFVFFFTYALLVLVSGVAYTKGCDDDAGLALSLICLFSLIECPLVVLLVLALWRTILAVTRFFGIYPQIEANLGTYLDPALDEQLSEHARAIKGKAKLIEPDAEGETP